MRIILSRGESKSRGGEASGLSRGMAVGGGMAAEASAAGVRAGEEVCAEPELIRGSNLT